MYRPVTDRPFIRSIRESEQTMKLYVGNLPFSFGSENLRALFAPLGEVTSAEVLSDRETGRSRGFGFVETGTRRDYYSRPREDALLFRKELLGEPEGV